MTDIQERAFKAGYDGVSRAQFMFGVKDKDKAEALKWFLKGFIQAQKESKK